MESGSNQTTLCNAQRLIVMDLSPQQNDGTGAEFDSADFESLIMKNRYQRLSYGAACGGMG